MNTPKLRSAQLITTFGIGAIVDTPEWSGMVAGQEFWRADRMNVIHEPRLQRKLSVSEFWTPKPWKKPQHGRAEVVSVPLIRFPLWHFCPQCRRLADLDWFGGPAETVCRRCSTHSDAKRLVPARFVVACEDGHISDFPWHWWVHRGASCHGAELEISSTGRSTTLASITVKCRTCERQATMEKAFDPGELASLPCRGERPWLRDRVACGKPLTAVQRGASNVYFAVTESAVSIPPFSSATARIVEKYWASLTLHDDPEDNRPILTNIAKREGMDSGDLWSAYLTRKTYGADGPTPDIRGDEYAALSAPPPMSDFDDFAAESVTVPDSHSWLQRVVLVHRLRVVTALDRFSRISSATTNSAQLASGAMTWRPAMEVNGEGLFLRPHEKALNDWIQKAGKPLAARVEKLEARRRDLINRGLRTHGSPVTPEMLLIHTLSHLLMRALILDCGYSSAALREMLYVRPATDTSAPMHGFLIYTAAADSEGSLGGLVRQGQPDRLGSLLSDAIETARWCSNDPLCLESKAQGTNSLNLASCHSCALVPETACEMFNCFLDRAVVVGTQDHPQLGFFTSAT